MNKHMFFVGIGGIGMSALAQLYRGRGFEVSGSDKILTLLTAALDGDGIRTYLEEDLPAVPYTAHEVVYSPAIPEDHPFLEQARKRGLPLYSYPEALGRFLEGFETVIAIAGTHGKTTTTAMLAKICIDGGLDPTVLVGATVKQLDGNNFRLGSDKLCIIEACEYRHSFLNYHPTHTIITNIEPEHLDFFKTERAYYDAFHKFAEQTTQQVILFEETAASIGASAKIQTVSPRMSLVVGVPGEHNRANASLAYEMARRLGLREGTIRESLRAFQGSDRRFEKKGVMENGALLYDDYAHHPTEIIATLKALKETYPNKQRIVVFQPHQYSRTTLFLERFGKAFGDADVVIIPDIYEVRDSEEEKAAISVDILVNEIAKYHPSVDNGNGQTETVNRIKANYDTPEHVIMLMGAGNITNMAVQLLGWKHFTRG